LALSVPEEGYSNLLAMSVPEEGYSNLSALTVPEVGYSRNASCALNLIYTILFYTNIYIKLRNDYFQIAGKKLVFSTTPSYVG